MGLNSCSRRILIALLFLAVEAQGAITVVNQGTVSNNVSQTTFGSSSLVTSNMAVGAMGILCIACDNAGSAGSAKIFSTSPVTDTRGNVWTLKLDFIYDPGAANAGVEVGCWVAPITTSLLVGEGPNFSFTTATSAKSAIMYELRPTAGQTLRYVSGAAKCDGCTSGQTGTAAQITTDTVPVGDAVLCMMGAEQTASVTADADTTNGSWSSQQFTSSAGTMELAAQWKIQTTASSTQSYDVTITSADWQTAYMHFSDSAVVANTAQFFPFFQP